VAVLVVVVVVSVSSTGRFHSCLFYTMERFIVPGIPLSPPINFFVCTKKLTATT
jgi:hypothetical protein